MPSSWPRSESGPTAATTCGDLVAAGADVHPRGHHRRPRLPLGLSVRDGAEASSDQPAELAGDPLLGLPALPTGRVAAAEPYRHLQPFTREEAAVFFGRGQAIRGSVRPRDLALHPAGGPLFRARPAWASRRCSTPG